MFGCFKIGSAFWKESNMELYLLFQLLLRTFLLNVFVEASLVVCIEITANGNETIVVQRGYIRFGNRFFVILRLFHHFIRFLCIALISNGFWSSFPATNRMTLLKSPNNLFLYLTIRFTYILMIFDRWFYRWISQYDFLNWFFQDESKCSL